MAKTIKIGDRFNDWEVVDGPFIEEGKENWDLKCTRCGKINRYTTRYILRPTFSKACRSCSQKARRQETGKYKIGTKIQNLTIIGEPYEYKGNTYYKVRCDCGHEYVTGHTTFSRKNRLPYCPACFSVDKKSHKKNTMVSEHISQTVYHRINKQAVERGIEFNLTPIYLEELLIKQNFKCALSGLPLQLSLSLNTKEQRAHHTASLDRIDSSLPYIEGNVQWVHKDINYMKCDFTQEEFINYCQCVVNNMLISSQASGTLEEGSETT